MTRALTMTRVLTMTEALTMTRVPAPVLAPGAPHLLHRFCRRAPPEPSVLARKSGRVCTSPGIPPARDSWAVPAGVGSGRRPVPSDGGLTGWAGRVQGVLALAGPGFVGEPENSLGGGDEAGVPARSLGSQRLGQRPGPTRRVLRVLPEHHAAVRAAAEPLPGQRHQLGVRVR